MSYKDIPEQPDRNTEDHRKTLCASRKPEPGKRKFYSNVGEWIVTDAWLDMEDQR